MFTKTDLAKFENVWDDHPKWVNLGAQKNFARYMLVFSPLCEISMSVTVVSPSDLVSLIFAPVVKSVISVGALTSMSRTSTAVNVLTC